VCSSDLFDMRTVFPDEVEALAERICEAIGGR
jgi:hypothetical protein